MLNSFVFPTIWNLKPVVWFGIISMVATLLATIVTEVLSRKTDTYDHKSTVKALFVVNLLLTLGVVAFGFAGGFVAAVAAYWFASTFREARGPIYDAWTNQNLEPKVRATVFSMCSQANAVGQIVGGPILGIVASIFAIRTSIVAAGLVLIPTLFLYNYSFRKHKLVA
jgi:DHA3 family tetracycline resistance protein-like MFS transporter